MNRFNIYVNDAISSLENTKIYLYDSTENWLDHPIMISYIALTDFMKQEKKLPLPAKNSKLPRRDPILTKWYEQKKKGIPDTNRVSLSPEQQQHISAWHLLLSDERKSKENNMPQPTSKRVGPPMSQVRSAMNWNR